MTSIRTLPIRLAPLDGEALDSWLEALAHRSDATWVDLLRAVGLPRARFGTFPSLVSVSAVEAASIATAAGISVDTVHAMTFARFTQTPLRTIAVQHPKVSWVFPWARTGGSRYCPTCLAESGGRWQLTWRLGWSFACLKHACLLADVCPKCAGVPRLRAVPENCVPVPGRCARSIARGDHRLLQTRCGSPLTEAATPDLGHGHPILLAQHTVDDIFHSGAADLGRYRDGPQPSVCALADIRRIAAHLLATEKRATISTTAGLDRLGVSYEPSHALIRPARGTAYRAEQWALTPHSSIAAIGITAAVLAMTTPPTAAAAMTTARFRVPRPPAETAALGNVVRPSNELRYRSSSAARLSHDATSSRITALTRRVPTMLWPAWSLRFALPHCQQSQIRPALSVLLLLVDTRLEMAEAAALLSSPLTRASCSRILQLLSNRIDWPETRTALGRIADHLADHDTPIDYQRRRQLNYDELLPDQVWTAICRDTSTLAPSPSRARIVRHYLYERLSGRPITDLHSAAVQSETITQVNNFPLHLTPGMARALEEHCRDFLCQSGIGDEPPFWSPPAALLGGLQLPGHDPDDVDIVTMEQLLGDSDLSGSRIAQRLNTTLPVVRHLCERKPARNPPCAGSADGRRARDIPALRRARSVLTPEVLAKLYGQDLRTLNEIAAEVGVSRGTVTQLAREYEIELRPGGTLPRRVVDRDWLYEEYVVKRRTLPDIAAELGMSPTNMARWARSHHIPRRPRGGTSHRAHLADQLAAESAPRLLRPTLAGVGGWQRLERFAIATQFPTMTAAAQHLRAPGLVLQLERLEAELGFKLFVRAERGRPMQLTDNGQRVLAAVRRAQRSRSRLSTPETPPTGGRPQPEG